MLFIFVLSALVYTVRAVLIKLIVVSVQFVYYFNFMHLECLMVASSVLIHLFTVMFYVHLIGLHFYHSRLNSNFGYSIKNVIPDM
jgi:hypothetical protein